MMCFFVKSYNYSDYENKKVRGGVKDATLHLSIWENNNTRVVIKMGEGIINLDYLKNLKVTSCFSTVNEGHESLKQDVYLQITTPCRNYAVYINQRLIELFMIDKNVMTLEEKKALINKLNDITFILNERLKK